jgi:hypothetical protein
VTHKAGGVGPVAGFVDAHLAPDIVSGWAIQHGHAKPLRIQVFGPEGLLGEGTAEHHREFPVGDCGFTIALCRPIRTSDLLERSVNVFATDGEGAQQRLNIWEKIEASIDTDPASAAPASGPRIAHKAPVLEWVRSKPWVRENSIVRQYDDPITMLNDEELRMLRWLAGRYYSGTGKIVDAGAFLGGSTVSLCKGLRDAGWIGRVIHSFDLFVADPYAAAHYGEGRFVAGSSTRALYNQAVAPYADLLSVYEGDITQIEWDGGDIEILLLDCLKTAEVNDSCVLKFFRHLIPGKSILIQQDYLWDQLPWIHISMEMLWDYFELLCDTEYDSVVFINKKLIPETALRAACWSQMSFEQRRAMMDRAISRWDGEKREHLVNAKNSGGLA